MSDENQGQPEYPYPNQPPTYPSYPTYPYQQAPSQPTPYPPAPYQQAPYQQGPYPYQQAPYQAAPPPRKSSNTPVIIVALVLLALVGGGAYYFTHQTASVNVAGAWDFTYTTSGGHTEHDALVLQQNGSQLTGQLTGEQGDKLDLTGSVSGQNIVLDATTSVSGGSCTAHLPGAVSDTGHMAGSATTKCTGNGQTGTDTGTWSAARSASQ